MSAAAGLTALGVSATGLAKMWFRFPDIPTLVTNRWFLAYVAVSFFIGAAVSYYFDSADSKIMDIISAALRLAGGSLVFYSLCQIWEVGAAAVLLLLLIAVRPGKAAHTERPVPSTPTGAASCDLLSSMRHFMKSCSAFRSIVDAVDSAIATYVTCNMWCTCMQRRQH